MDTKENEDLTTGEDNINFDDIDDALFEGASDSNLEIDAEAVADTKVEEVTVEDVEELKADEAAKKEQTEAPKAEDVTDAAEAEEEPAKPNDGTMPYGAYAAEKSKRVDLEGKVSTVELENNQLKAELALLKSQQPKPKAPDMYDDPLGYEKHVQQTANDAHYNQMLNTAKIVAPSIVPQADITAAEAYFASQGISADKLEAANRDALSKGQNPIVELVNWHKGELQKQEFAQWQASQAANAQNPSAAAQQPQPKAKLPPNVAGIAPANVKSESFASLDDIDNQLFG